MGYYRVVRFRSNEEASDRIKKAKGLMEEAMDMMEDACEMLKNGMDERGGMDERRMRDSRGRFMGRDHWDERMEDERMDERRMRGRGYDGMFDRGGRFGY